MRPAVTCVFSKEKVINGISNCHHALPYVWRGDELSLHPAPCGRSPCPSSHRPLGESGSLKEAEALAALWRPLAALGARAEGWRSPSRALHHHAVAKTTEPWALQKLLPK